MASGPLEKIAFVSGANRGLGFGLTTGLADRGYRVIGGYRDASRSSRLLEAALERENVHAFQIDVTSEIDLEKLRDYLQETFGRLDLLINNAGINLEKGRALNELDWGTFAETFRVNLGGPFLTSRILYPLLLRGTEKKIVNMSSKMGSVALSDGTMTPYRVSKASVNMLTKSQSIAYRKDGVTVICVHPGWVRTDMGGSQATYSVEDSVEKILAIVERVSLEETGQFLSAEGGSLPF